MFILIAVELMNLVRVCRKMLCIHNKFIILIDNGFCDYDFSFTSPDNRGVYNWNETEVGKTDKQMCFFEPLNEGGFAIRKCRSRQMWDPYNGSLCVTENTYRLRLLSRVCLNINFKALITRVLLLCM